MTHGDITIEIKSDTLSEAISIRDFLVTFKQVLITVTRLQTLVSLKHRPLECAYLYTKEVPELITTHLSPREP